MVALAARPSKVFIEIHSRKFFSVLTHGGDTMTHA